MGSKNINIMVIESNKTSTKHNKNSNVIRALAAIISIGVLILAACGDNLTQNAATEVIPLTEESWIYFDREENGTYKIRTDGTEQTQLTNDSVSTFEVDGYFEKHH